MTNQQSLDPFILFSKRIFFLPTKGDAVCNLYWRRKGEMHDLFWKTTSWLSCQPKERSENFIFSPSWIYSILFFRLNWFRLLMWMECIFQFSPWEKPMEIAVQPLNKLMQMKLVERSLTRLGLPWQLHIFIAQWWEITIICRSRKMLIRNKNEWMLWLSGMVTPSLSFKNASGTIVTPRNHALLGTQQSRPLILVLMGVSRRRRLHTIEILSSVCPFRGKILCPWKAKDMWYYSQLHL